MNDSEPRVVEIVDAPTASVTPKVATINIADLPIWITNAISTSEKNEKGETTVKRRPVMPSELKILYTLFLWEHISKNHVKGDVTADTPNLENDDTKVVLTTEEATRLCKIYYRFKPTFDFIFHS